MCLLSGSGYVLQFTCKEPRATETWFEALRWFRRTCPGEYEVTYLSFDPFRMQVLLPNKRVALLARIRFGEICDSYEFK